MRRVLRVRDACYAYATHRHAGAQQVEGVGHGGGGGTGCCARQEPNEDVGMKQVVGLAVCAILDHPLDDPLRRT
eukprot:7277404-Pyramimonas_sp.AAC.1